MLKQHQQVDSNLFDQNYSSDSLNDAIESLKKIITHITAGHDHSAMTRSEIIKALDIEKKMILDVEMIGPLFWGRMLRILEKGVEYLNLRKEGKAEEEIKFRYNYRFEYLFMFWSKIPKLCVKEEESDDEGIKTVYLHMLLHAVIGIPREIESLSTMSKLDFYPVTDEKSSPRRAISFLLNIIDDFPQQILKGFRAIVSPDFDQAKPKNESIHEVKQSLRDIISGLKICTSTGDMYSPGITMYGLNIYISKCFISNIEADEEVYPLARGYIAKCLCILLQEIGNCKIVVDGGNRILFGRQLYGDSLYGRKLEYVRPFGIEAGLGIREEIWTSFIKSDKLKSISGKVLNATNWKNGEIIKTLQKNCAIVEKYYNPPSFCGNYRMKFRPKSVDPEDYQKRALEFTDTEN
jgi:hypothetical protein